MQLKRFGAMWRNMKTHKAFAKWVDLTTVRTLNSQKVFLKWFCKNQFPHKIVNILF